MSDDIISQLKKTALFGELSEEALVALSQKASTRRLDQGPATN